MVFNKIRGLFNYIITELKSASGWEKATHLVKKKKRKKQQKTPAERDSSERSPSQDDKRTEKRFISQSCHRQCFWCSNQFELGWRSEDGRINCQSQILAERGKINTEIIDLSQKRSSMWESKKLTSNRRYVSKNTHTHRVGLIFL